MTKRLLFVGAGAIGSYLGGHLARAGHDVTLIDPWAEQVETIRRDGLAVEGPHEPFVARPAAVHLHEAARLPRDFEIVFVAMKAYDTAWATQLALRHAAPAGAVVSAQNCWPDPIVASIAGASPVGRSGHVEDRRRALDAGPRRARRREGTGRGPRRVPGRRARRPDHAARARSSPGCSR